ncbi:MAG: ACP phosphodiesterase [Panacagrimonas sp.]
MQDLATNFLAHLWLADRTQTSLAGSVLGDVVRGSDLSAYPDDIALGIRLHRKVDAATDRHSVMREARGLFSEGERRYAGIVLDLAADRALAALWPDFSPQEALPDFAIRCGLAMALAEPWFIRGGGRAPTAAGFADLLMSYASDPGIGRAIERTAARMREPERLIAAGRCWTDMCAILQPQMRRLLGDLTATMNSQISCGP